MLDHDEFRKNFDAQFRSTKRIAIGGAVAGFGIWITVLCFVGWVFVKLMSHFGVI